MNTNEQYERRLQNRKIRTLQPRDRVRDNTRYPPDFLLPYVNYFPAAWLAFLSSLSYLVLLVRCFCFWMEIPLDCMKERLSDNVK